MMKSKRGFTLIELLISFLIFIALIMVLVNLTTVTLDAWNQGEERKDTIDRHQAVLSIIEEDLRNLYAERRPLWIGTEDAKRYLLGAHLVCDIDKNKRQRIRFVRVADRDETLAKPLALDRRPHPADVYTNLYEVSYMMDEDPEKNILYRAVRYFDRDDQKTYLVANPKFNKNEYKPIDKNVLYLEFKFWAQDTNCWEAAGAPRNAQPMEATFDWDSSRRFLNKFRFYQRRVDFDNPDPVYPEMIQVTMVVKPQAFEDRKFYLTAEMADHGSELLMNSTKELPDAPNFVKVGGEWMEYSEKTPSALKIRKRAARNSKRTRHELGEEVQFGETFVSVIYIPVRQEALGK